MLSSSRSLDSRSSEKLKSRTMNLWLEMLLSDESAGMKLYITNTNLFSRHFWTNSSCTRRKMTTETRVYSSSESIALSTRTQFNVKVEIRWKDARRRTRYDHRGQPFVFHVPFLYQIPRTVRQFTVPHTIVR